MMNLSESKQKAAKNLHILASDEACRIEMQTRGGKNLRYGESNPALRREKPTG